MKTGVIDFRECAVTVRCPDCNRALQKDESQTFWSDEYIPGLTAWCDRCDIMVELPDLSVLKPIEGGLLDRMINALKYAERVIDDSAVWVAIHEKPNAKDEADKLHDVITEIDSK